MCSHHWISVHKRTKYSCIRSSSRVYRKINPSHRFQWSAYKVLILQLGMRSRDRGVVCKRFTQVRYSIYIFLCFLTTFTECPENGRSESYNYVLLSSLKPDHVNSFVVDVKYRNTPKRIKSYDLSLVGCCCRWSQKWCTLKFVFRDATIIFIHEQVFLNNKWM